MRTSLSWIRFFAALFVVSAVVTNCLAELPPDMYFEPSTFGGYSVSAKGEVFAIFREDGSGNRFERSGNIFIRFGEQSIELPALPPNSFPADSPKHEERVVINPDGHFVMRVARGHVVIRSLPDASLAWQGTLANTKYPLEDAYYFSASDRRLVVVDHGILRTFLLPNEGPATQVGFANVAFAGDDPKSLGHYDFVQAAVFTGDGKTLFVGNKGGEVLAINLSDETPRLRWRAQVFQSFKTLGFNDDWNRSVSRLQCADECRMLAVSSYRDKQVAVVDAVKGDVLGKVSYDGRLGLVGVGNGLFAMTPTERGAKNLLVVNSKLEPKLPLDISADRTLLFGIPGGFASGGYSTSKWGVSFTNTDQVLAEARRQSETEAA